MPKHKDMAGLQFGRLTVLSRAENNARQDAQWLCRCDCGTEKVIAGTVLRQGKAVSCGCLKAEKASTRMKRMKTTHGLSNTALHRVWGSMLDRCRNPKCKSYPNYGGRGIKVYDGWVNCFEAFYLWAMNNGYAPGLQLDRRDNDGPYAPWNCRWITQKDNCQNTRKCTKVRIIPTSGGDPTTASTIAEASRITGIGQATIQRMLNGMTTRVTAYRFERDTTEI